MSFDLKFVSGDLKIGPEGDLAIVENTEKLVQDIIKILSTKIGANPFFPWYGSPLTQSMVGRAFDERFVANVATQQLRSSLERIQTLQREQLKKNQVITPEETLAAIQSVKVEQNPVDPRFYRIFLTVLSRALRPIDVPMEFEVI